jgi:hypothetical protein
MPIAIMANNRINMRGVGIFGRNAIDANGSISIAMQKAIQPSRDMDRREQKPPRTYRKRYI